MGKVEKEMKQMKEQAPSASQKNSRSQLQSLNILDQVTKNANISDRSMSMEEKTQLKNSIGMLTPDQQRGIITIVSECINQNN